MVFTVCLIDPGPPIQRQDSEKSWRFHFQAGKRLPYRRSHDCVHGQCFIESGFGLLFFAFSSCPLIMTLYKSRAVLASCLLALLAACASPPQKEGDSADARKADAAKPAGGAAETKAALVNAGASLGCGVANLLSKDCEKGAAFVSNIVDKAVSWVFRVLKITDAQDINREYEERNVKVSKTAIVPMALSTLTQCSM